MKGMGILNTPRNDVFFIQQPLKFSHGSGRTRDHAQCRAIDQRNGQISGKQGKHFLLRKRDGKHGSLRQVIDQPGSCGNHP